MAKINLGNSSSNVLPRAKGIFYVRQDKRTGPVAQTVGPVGKRKTDSPYKFYQRQEFRIAAAWAASSFALEIESASNMAQGTNFVWRDLIIKAMYGNLWEFTTHDGTVYRRMRDVTPNAQLVLDLITQDAGSLLWRSKNGWVGLEPGNNGYVLAIINGAPFWVPSGVTGGGSIEFKLYEANDTWTKPAWAQWVKMVVVGGGGGGGSGCKHNVGTQIGGGGGGEGAGLSYAEFSGLQLPPTAAITIGAKGIGGASQTATNTNGNAGTPGADTTIVAGDITLFAAGGNQGNGGTNSTGGQGGSGRGTGLVPGADGGGGGWGDNGHDANQATEYACGGGGGGAGQQGTLSSKNGGKGSPQHGVFLRHAQGTGGLGATKTNPSTPPKPMGYGLSSLGYGGGWVNIDGTAGEGFDAPGYGAGGSGGGSSIGTNNSGRGGDGGQGAALIISM